MKKITALVLSAIIILGMLTGCRRQPTGNPGDPTVNNSSTTESTRATAPSTSTQATRPGTDPSRHTTAPDSTTDTGNGMTGDNSFPSESTTNSEGRNRERMLPRR